MCFKLQDINTDPAQDPPHPGDNVVFRFLMPDPGHFQERLGLFFMLVLGEAVLGLCTTNYTSHSMSKLYRVLM